MTVQEHFERVYVETEWYDGPRAGVANLLGEPHRFKSRFDEKADEYTGTFVVWPIDAQELALELEQWLIFIEWNALYESGAVDTGTHPAHRGQNARWDEIDDALRAPRSIAPASAKHAFATVQFLDRDKPLPARWPGVQAGLEARMNEQRSRARLNPSLKLTRYGRRGLAATGQGAHCPSAAKPLPPPRAAQLKR